jgi:hypothetical protein
MAGFPTFPTGVTSVMIDNLQEKGFQTENVLFRKKPINVIEQFLAAEIAPLCSGEMLIFRNSGKALSLGIKFNSLYYKLVAGIIPV